MERLTRDGIDFFEPEMVFRIMDTLVEASYRHALQLGFVGDKNDYLTRLQDEAAVIVKETAQTALEPVH